MKALELMVNKAIEDGKIRPDQKAWALDYVQKDFAGFQVFVAKAHATPDVPDRYMSDSPAHEVDEVQMLINKMCGVDDETFQMYSPEAVVQANKSQANDSEIDETQRMINALFGIDDETFRKYGPSGSEV
jgi:hypothetical protein